MCTDFFNDIEDIEELIGDGVIAYHVSHEPIIFNDENEDFDMDSSYLIYDKNKGGDFEVAITYDGIEDKYEIMHSSLDDYFCNDVFDFYQQALIYLFENFSLVKKIRR